MATMLKHGKKVTRIIEDAYPRPGKWKQAVARMTTEGVWIKLEKERWTTAYLVPWRALYSVGGKMKADEIKKARAEKRKMRGKL